MAEGAVMEDVVKTEVGEDTSMCDENDQPFALLLRVTQLNGKPFTYRWVYRKGDVSDVA